MNAPLSNTSVGNAESPFATREPDVYRADSYLSMNGTTDRYFIARNATTRRFDTFANDKLMVTELVKDNNRYVIDHTRKVYYVDMPGDKGPSSLDPASLAFFQNTVHHEFEEIGRDGDAVTYHAKKLPGDPDQDIVVTVDQKTGLMMSEEVKSADASQAFVYELKNVNFDVPVDLFQIPAGYKQVGKDEFRSPRKSP